MPRTFKATIALIAVLALLSVITLVNIIQTNSTQSSVVKLEQQVDALVSSNEQIRQQLATGVAVSGSAAGSPSSGGADKYADALNDPANLLVAATDLKVPADAKMGGTLQAYLSSDLKGFNWITENSVDVSNLQTLVHNSFTRRDFNNPDNFVPELAYKVTVNDDFTEYTIHIRDDVYWQTPRVDFSNPDNEWLRKPRKLTAEDCVFYFEIITNPQVEAGALKSYYEEFDKAWVVDENTFSYTSDLLLKLAATGTEMHHTDENTLTRVKRFHPGSEYN